MAKQIQITLAPYGYVSPGDMDVIAYEASKFIQSRLPCKVLGYGTVEVEAPEVASLDQLRKSQPAAESINEVAAPIRMGT